MKYETQDGWDLDSITPLQDAVEAYNNMGYDIYELKNCVRQQSLVEMRDSLLRSIEDMKYALNRINDDDIVVEIEDN